jgi:hypothetical protein
LGYIWLTLRSSNMNTQRLDQSRADWLNKLEAIEEAGRVWRHNIAPIPDLKRRIRAEAEAEIEREVERRRAAAARAIQAARDAGASKVSLREVTTKNHYDFEAYVAFGEELARK